MRALLPEKLFELANIEPTGSAMWGEPVPEPRSGIYVISVIDGVQVAFDERFEPERPRWDAGQPIIYIGRARSIARRLRQFYRHRYGDPSPHFGGRAIHLLQCPKIVQWAAREDCGGAEDRLIKAFEGEVGRLPFGNRVSSARLRPADPEVRISEAAARVAGMGSFVISGIAIANAGHSKGEEQSDEKIADHRESSLLVTPT